MNDTEKLARDIFEWQTHTGPMGITWDNIDQSVRDRLLAAAALPTEERLKHSEFLTFEEMNPQYRKVEK